MTEIFVRGQGGGIEQLTLPPRGTVRREIVDGQLARGDLERIDAELVEKVEIRGGGYAWALKGESLSFRGYPGADARRIDDDHRHVNLAPDDPEEVTRGRLARRNGMNPGDVELS